MRNSSGGRANHSAAALLIMALVAFLLMVTSVAAEEEEVKLNTFEKSIGEQAAEQILQQYGGEYYPPFPQYVVIDEIFQRLDGAAQRRDVEYTLTILNTPQINAFALPGGYIFLTRGLLQHMNGDPQAVAAVLGHEIAHVELRHGVQALARQLGLTLLVELGLIFFDLYNHDAVRTAGAVLVEMTRSGWSREAEFEADAMGMDLAVKAGFDPMGSVYAMDFLRQLERGQLPMAWFRSHPDEVERQTRLQEQATSYWEPIPSQTLAEQTTPYTALVQDPLGRYTLSFEEHHGAHNLRIWDGQNAEYRSWPEHFSEVSAAHWSPDGQYLAVAGKDTRSHAGIWLLDRYGRGQTPWRQIPAGEFLSLAWESSGQRLVYARAAEDGSVDIKLAYIGGQTDVLVGSAGRGVEKLLWNEKGVLWFHQPGEQWEGVSVPGVTPVRPAFPVPRVIAPDFRPRPEVTVEGEGDDTIFRIRRPSIVLP